MYKGKMVALLLSIAVLGVAFAGCVGGGGGEGEKGVTIVIWHALQTSEEQVWKSLIEQFESEHPDINIEFQHKADLETVLKAAIPQGQGPDLFIWAHDWIGKFAEGGLLKPIDQYVTQDVLNNFIDVAQQAIEYNGHYYGMPVAAETVALIYNKDLVPNPPQTFDEKLQIIQQYHNPDNDMYGFSTPVDPYFVSAWAHAFGGYYFDDTTKTPGLNDPKTIEGLKLFFDEIFFKYMAQTRDYNSQIALFLEGKTPFHINGPWSIKQIRDSGVNFGVTVLPKIVKDGTEYYPKPYAGVKVIYVTANAADEKMDAIWTFLSWLTLSESNMKTLSLQLGYIPVLKTLQNDADIQSDPVISGFLAELEHATLMPKSPEMGSVWSPIDTALTKIVSGEATVEDAFEEAQQSVLQELGSAG